MGGTLGGIVGGAATALLVKKIGPLNLLFISTILLELAARCVRFFPAQSTRSDATPVPMDGGEEKPLGGNIWAGVTHVVRSPYLLGISAFLLLYGVTSTLAYSQQADIAAHQFQNRANRTAFFAQVDLSVNVLTILAQISLTGRLLKWLGVGITLAFLPAVNVIGFLAMGWIPLLSLLVVFQTLRRASNFGVSRPAREVLFTVLRREDK